MDTASRTVQQEVLSRLPPVAAIHRAGGGRGLADTVQVVVEALPAIAKTAQNDVTRSTIGPSTMRRHWGGNQRAERVAVRVGRVSQPPSTGPLAVHSGPDARFCCGVWHSHASGRQQLCRARELVTLEGLARGPVSRLVFRDAAMAWDPVQVDRHGLETVEEQKGGVAERDAAGW